MSVEAKVTGLIEMVEESTYCIDVLHEIAAAKSALDGIALSLVDGHVRSCLGGASAAEREERAGELMAAVGRLVKIA